jgi:hypothetical protein
MAPYASSWHLCIAFCRIGPHSLLTTTLFVLTTTLFVLTPPCVLLQFETISTIPDTVLTSVQKQEFMQRVASLCQGSAAGEQKKVFFNLVRDFAVRTRSSRQ